MDKVEALEALLKKIEMDDWDIMRDEPHEITGLNGYWGYFDDVMHKGSLDAALALHNAVLPDEGWEVYRTAKYPGMIPGSCPSPFKAIIGWGAQVSGHSDTPARAWLIAILRALIAIDQNAPREAVTRSKRQELLTQRRR